MTRTRLRWTLGLLLVALAVPSAVLVLQTQRQLKWEAFHQQRQLAVELADRIDERLRQLVAAEEARGYADYAFLTVADVDAARFNVAQANRATPLLQRSPLAEFPVRSNIPGLLGWFQIDAAGGFDTPLLPDEDEVERLGLDAEEFSARRALADQLLDVLGRNELAVRRTPASTDDTVGESKASVDERSDSRREDAGTYAAQASEAEPATGSAEERMSKERPPSPQAVFDQLKSSSNAPRKQSDKALGNVADLQLQDAYADRDVPRKDKQALVERQRGRRVEQTALPAESGAPDGGGAPAVDAAAPLRIFDSELDPFEFAQLGSGHFVLFRRVWRNGERSIQGALIQQNEFLRGAIQQPFAASLLAPVSELLVAWQGEVLQRFEATSGRSGSYISNASYVDDELSGTLLHRTRLAAPLADFELIWTIRRLPTSPGVSLVFWAGAVLFAVLLAGFLALYRLGLRQLALARQQQGFIAAVSHELKTPLTSIRMYGELLRAGWASEEKKREYYDYIHDESERLSRLIANVLQLARLERDELQLELKPHSVVTLFDLIRSRVQSQIERAGFQVEFDLDPTCADHEVAVDADALIQIMINLVDNALKFSARAEQRRIEIKVAPAGKQLIAFSVRDFGPGIPAAMRRRVFDLFFRGGDELTRETQGTGIGLALVRQLAQGMGGEIDLQPRQPGVEFRLLLPV